jgi:hypothetical protein
MVNYVIFASMDYHSRVDIMLKIAIKVYQRNGSSAVLGDMKLEWEVLRRAVPLRKC